MGQAMWQNQFKWHFMFFSYVSVLLYLHFFFGVHNPVSIHVRPQNSPRVTCYIRHVGPRAEGTHRRSHHRPVERQKRLLVVRDKVRPTRNVIPIEIFDWTFRGSFVFVLEKRESLVIETALRFFRSRRSRDTFAATKCLHISRLLEGETFLAYILMTYYHYCPNNNNDNASLTQTINLWIA